MSNEEILELEITPNQYFIAWCIHTNRKDLFEKLIKIEKENKVKGDLYILYKKHFLNCELCEAYTFDFDKMKIDKLFDKNTPKSFDKNAELNIFTKELYEMFPIGIKSGNYSVRSGFNDFGKKLEKYIETHKKENHTLEVIRKAFILYIERCKKNNWQYMKLAGYFISKDGTSTLESVCEEVINNPQLIENDRREHTGTFRAI